MFLLNIIPWWGRILAVLALVGAVWGHGAYTGYQHAHGQTVTLQAQFDTFKAETAALGKVAEAHTAAVVKEQQEITAHVKTDYQNRLAGIVKLYSSVRQPELRSDGSEIPILSCPAPRVDAGPADPVLVESIPKADFDQLRKDAAVTTLMLTGLQDWVRQQQAAFR